MRKPIFVNCSSSLSVTGPRSANDLYCTPPEATRALLKKVAFCEDILEPCCGLGHISEELIAAGYTVLSEDLISHGYPKQERAVDFFSEDTPITRDIVTNPPYSQATEFVLHAMERLVDGHKLACLLRLQFLEGQQRYQALLSKYPPQSVLVFTNRIRCFKLDDESATSGSSALAYAWFVWEKGRTTPPTISWLTTNL